MTKQEENWEFMTVLNIPWSEANSITEREDRDFLLQKAARVKQMLEQAQAQQEAALQQQTPENIITPT